MSGTTVQRRRGVKVLTAVFCGLFVVLCVVALLVYLGFHSRPSHWDIEQTRLAQLPDAQRKVISASLRNRLMTQWSDPGDKTPITEDDLFGHRNTIAIPYADLNTWIMAEGIDLLAEIGVTIPPQAKSAMIDSPGNGLLRISFEIKAEDIDQVVALSFAVSIADDGTLTSTLRHAAAGRLPLPVATAIDLVASQTDAGILLDLMRGEPVPAIVLPIDPSNDGVRDGRLVGLEVQDDALLVTRETVRRRSAEKARNAPRLPISGDEHDRP